MTPAQIKKIEQKQLMDEIKILNAWFKIKDLASFIKEHGSLEVAHAVLCQRFDQRKNKTNLS